MEFHDNRGTALDAPEAIALGGAGRSAEHGVPPRVPFSWRLWSHRNFLFRCAAVGLVVGILLAFVLPKTYVSTTRLMPPDESSSPMGILSLMARAVGDSDLLAPASDMLGGKSSGALFVGILHSRSVQDELINRFDLRRVYRVRLYEQARKELESRSSIVEDRKSGIISISVEDRSPLRARDMARVYVDALNRAVSKLSTSSARREREFLEERLKAVRHDLDQAEIEFSQFASKNTAIDIPAQNKAMLEAAATLQGEIIAAQSQLQSLEQIYTPNNVRVRSARAQLAELKRQLESLGGSNASLNEQGEDNLYPSIRQLPLLGVTYANLYRKVKVQEAVFESLTKQYEVAKVQEAKEIPTVRVLDPPEVPERKSWPPRLQIIALFPVLGMLLGSAWIWSQAKWESIDSTNPRKLLAQDVFAAFQASGSRTIARVRLLRRKGKRSTSLQEESFSRPPHETDLG